MTTFTEAVNEAETTTNEAKTTPAEVETEETEGLTPFVCPACGETHLPTEYANLDTECQIQLAVFDFSNKKTIPTMP